MGFRDFLSTERGVPTAAAALAAQRGTARTDGLLAIAGLAISATATKFKTTRETIIALAGVVGAKAATDLLVFSAAHVVTAAKFGAILVQMTPAGVISTKAEGTPQAFATAAAALAALPAADAGNVALGHIAIAAGVADWTANTDALTDIAAFVDNRQLGSESL